MKSHWILMTGLVLGMAAIICTGLTVTNNRQYGDGVVKVAFSQASWTAGDANAVTETAYNLNGLLTRIDMIASAAQADPNVAITFRDQNNCILVPDALFATQDVNAVAMKLAHSNKATQDADFNPVPLSDTAVTMTITPSADPNGALTVDVILYLE